MTDDYGNAFVVYLQENTRQDGLNITKLPQGDRPTAAVNSEVGVLSAGMDISRGSGNSEFHPMHPRETGRFPRR